MKTVTGQNLNLSTLYHDRQLVAMVHGDDGLQSTDNGGAVDDVNGDGWMDGGWR